MMGKSLNLRYEISKALFDPVLEREKECMSLKIWNQCIPLHSGVARTFSDIDIELALAINMGRYTNGQYTKTDRKRLK